MTALFSYRGDLVSCFNEVPGVSTPCGVETPWRACVLCFVLSAGQGPYCVRPSGKACALASVFVVVYLLYQ